MSEELRRCKGSTVEVQNTKAAVVTKVDVNHGGKENAFDQISQGTKMKDTVIK